jgi:hypothetical protein
METLVRVLVRPEVASRPAQRQQRRNYKTAIPVYFIEERRMQMLLPFHSSNGRDISCFLVERDDVNRCYKIKTILDMDQAFFAARLITRPDKEWLNP